MSGIEIIINWFCFSYKFGSSGSNYLGKQLISVKVNLASTLKLPKIKE